MKRCWVELIHSSQAVWSGAFGAGLAASRMRYNPDGLRSIFLFSAR
jgi:hypothetical protein